MFMGKTVYAVVLGAGRGTRIGFDKMLYSQGGETVIEKSVKAFSRCEYVDKIIVVGGENIEEITRLCRSINKVCAVVKGGNMRAVSVMNAVNTIAESGFVAVHDGARPFVTDSLIRAAVEGARETGAAIPCVAVKDTIKQREGDFIGQTYDRSRLLTVQTPQVFDIDLYKRLAERYFDENITDDAQLFEKGGIKIKVTPGDYANYKITTIDDIKKEKTMRIGHGYDVHKLVEGRKLILGGVDIPYEKGLLGHSDADVLLHAVMDALLGAMALGDIGKHFPDTDEKYSGADSQMLLRAVGEILKENGASVGNIDATIICQKPKLAPHIPQMRENIAECLGCDVGCVSVKATTEEHLGFTGEGLGIAAHSVCIVNTK